MKKYHIFFGTIKEKEEGLTKKNVQIEKEFDFYDYNSSSSFRKLKEFFLSLYGNKFNYCPCVLSVCQLKKDAFIVLSNNDNDKISDVNTSHLYIIKNNDEKCECQIEDYFNNFYQKDKFDIFIELRKMRQVNQKLEQKNSELEKSNNELKIKIEALTKKGEEDIKKSEDFYDVIVDIKSIKGIKDGWDIKWEERGKNLYLKCKKKKCLTLGVIGNRNKGKSFLLSKISNTKLLSGTHIETEGLSIKYHDSKYKPIILLDSAGLETPVLKKINEKEDKKDIKKGNEDDEIEKEKNENLEFKENAKDKLMTELFLQDFIIQNSNILLLVVGILTYSEQLLINKIKYESKKRKRDNIIIVHNLQNFRKKEQVENYIKNTLLKCATFNLNKHILIDVNSKEDNNENKIEDNNENKNEDNENKIEDKEDKEEFKKIEKDNEEQPKDNNNIIKNENIIEQKEIEEIESGKPLHFYEVLYYDKNKKMNIYHLILANEDSDDVRFFNQYTYDFIQKLYNAITGTQKFDVLEQIKKDFKSIAPKMLNNEIEDPNWNKNEDMIKDKKILLNLEEEISFKKCVIDELGFSFFKTGNFEPKYNYFLPEPKTLEIRLEIPGNADCKSSFKIENENTIIKIEGEKTKDKQPEKVKDNIYNIREFSKFEVLIPLPVEKYQILGNKEKGPTYKDGLWKFKFELADKGEECSGQVNDN